MGPTVLDSWANAIKDGVTAVSVPLTAWVAIRGLNTWQRQMKGAAEFELMRNVLRAVFKVRDALRAARAPVSWAGEGADVVSEDPEVVLTPLDKSLIFRWRNVTSVTADLDVVMNEAETVWGMEARRKLELMNAPISNLGAAFSSFMDLRKATPPLTSEERQELKSLRQIVYFHGAFDGAGDDFDQKLQSAVRQIEEYVRGKVK